MTLRPFSAVHEPAAGMLVVQGEVDTSDCPVLRNVLNTHSAAFTRHLVVDLTEVDFLSSPAVAVLARALDRAQSAGGKLELRAGRISIAARVLQIHGLPYQAV